MNEKIRVYEHRGTLYVRGNGKSTKIALDPERIPHAKEMLQELDKEGQLRFITLRTILEEH